MKKRVISAILCGMMAASLLGTVAFADETKTFTVGFDAGVSALRLHGRRRRVHRL